MKEAQKALEAQYQKPEQTILTIRDIGLPRQLLLLVREIYQDPNTNRHTKEVIYFKLKQFLGDEYDVKGFLNNKD